MKKFIFVVMFLLGIGNTVYSQSKKTEKVIKEYHLSAYPVETDSGEINLRCIFPNNKKLQQFLQYNLFSSDMSFYVDSTYSLVVEEVRPVSGSKFFRLKEKSAEQYPKITDPDHWEIACFSKQVKLSNGKYSVDVYCVQGVLNKNPSVSIILKGLFEDKVINPNLRFTVILKDKDPSEKDLNLKTFVLAGVTYVTCPEVIKK